MAPDDLVYDYVETVIAIREEKATKWWFDTDHEDCPTASFAKDRGTRERQDWWKWEDEMRTYVAYGQCPSCGKAYRLCVAPHILMQMRLLGTTC